ncbi:MAG: DoxX family membrane protein [Deltaproteobacteria bacterium]|nr:DoxX family membrane protein [Deltaproteobacteria bacterium]
MATHATSWSADEIPTPTGLRGFYYSRFSAPLWLAVRLGVGATWLYAGIEKLVDANGAWMGAYAGAAVRGFVADALAKNMGPRPEVSGWYAAFLRDVVLPHATFFSVLVTVGEIAVGLGLIAGLFTGVAAFFGGFMNLCFMLAGTAGINPVLFVLATWLVLAWRVAGHWGLDRWVLPRLGAPGWPGPRAWRRRELLAAFRNG